MRAAVDGWRAARVWRRPSGTSRAKARASQDPAAGTSRPSACSLDELRARDVRPFAAVARRAPAVQLSDALYAAWDGVTPATLLPEAITLLRQDLGFRGVIVSGDACRSDARHAARIAGTTAVAALQAGCDLLWLPGDARGTGAGLAGGRPRDPVAASCPRRAIAQSLARIVRLRRGVGLGQLDAATARERARRA